MTKFRETAIDRLELQQLDILLSLRQVLRNVELFRPREIDHS